MTDDIQNLDPYDLHLSCRCGMALEPYGCYEPEVGAYLCYAARWQDVSDAHLHDIAIVTLTMGITGLSVYEGKCQQKQHGERGKEKQVEKLTEKEKELIGACKKAVGVLDFMLAHPNTWNEAAYQLATTLLAGDSEQLLALSEGRAALQQQENEREG